jgi:hypothetical protein
MSRLCQRTFTLAVVLSLSMLVLVPMGFGATAHAGSNPAMTGPTMPPYPWEGLAAVSATADTGPTLPPIPWCG